jgi:hypothetical protein
VAAAKGEWRLDPVTAKVKWAEEENRLLVGSGWGYYTTNFRWTNDVRWRNLPSPSQPAYYQTKLRQRLANDWWLGTTGRYSTAPTCDFRWVELEVEKTLTKPVAIRVWGEGEWRRVTAGSNLQEYGLHIVGSRIRWRLMPPLQWKGELSQERKNYASPVNSSRKMAVSNELTWRISHHRLLGRWAESTRVYPENSWRNYHHRSLRLEWQWDINRITMLTANCSYNQQSQGSGKEGGKLQFTGILDYPYSRRNKLSWLVSGTKIVDTDDPSLEDEDTEPLPPAVWRLGLRWQEWTPPVTLRTELYGIWTEEGLESGVLLRLQGDISRLRWTLGLAPQGGFYPTEEKGYWVEVKYYFD